MRGFEDIALPFVHGIPGDQFKRIHLVPDVPRRKSVAYLRLSNMLTKNFIPREDGWLRGKRYPIHSGRW